MVGRRKKKVTFRIAPESKIQFQLQMERKGISGFKKKKKKKKVNKYRNVLKYFFLFEGEGSQLEKEMVIKRRYTKICRRK